MEKIHQVLGNLVRTSNISQTYVDEDEPWSGILAAAVFEIRSTTNRQEGYGPVKLISDRVIILPIELMVDWEIIS